MIPARLMRFACAAAGLAAAAAAVGLFAPTAATGSGEHATAARDASQIAFQRGATVGEWGPTAYAPKATERTMRRMKREYGARWVTLFVVWMQEDGESTTIAPGSETVRTPRLVRAIRAAQRRGLGVILRPYIDRDDGEWRGDIAPSSVRDWFGSYRSFILTWARFARRQGVDGFVVGSELQSMERYTAQWKRIVSSVRREFKGFLTFESNWNSYWEVRWWRKLDAIDVSAYFPVATRSDPSVHKLVKGWQDHYRRLKRFHRKLRMPVIFGEIGYRTAPGTAIFPWDTGVRSGPGYSVQAQKRAYQAALRVWYRVPWFRGMHWWYVPTQPELVAGKRGADHAPARPARKVLKRWYSKRR